MANRGKIVIVAALDATFKRTEFGKILQLVPLAESVVKLNAVCMSCFNDASFTKRISNEKEVSIAAAYALFYITGQTYKQFCFKENWYLVQILKCKAEKNNNSVEEIIRDGFYLKWMLVRSQTKKLN